MASGTMSFHSNGHHVAPAGIGLVAVAAAERLIAGRRLDAALVHMHLVRELQIGMLLGARPKVGLFDPGLPDGFTALMQRFEQIKRKSGMIASEIRRILQR